MKKGNCHLLEISRRCRTPTPRRNQRSDMHRSHPTHHPCPPRHQNNSTAPCSQIARMQTQAPAQKPGGRPNATRSGNMEGSWQCIHPCHRRIWCSITWSPQSHDKRSRNGAGRNARQNRKPQRLQSIKSYTTNKETTQSHSTHAIDCHLHQKSRGCKHRNQQPRTNSRSNISSKALFTTRTNTTMFSMSWLRT
jgi:hypothetical protein